MSRHFTVKELSCHCGCGFMITDREFLERLDRIRDLVGQELIISSPARCKAYNTLIGGALNSAHVRALAVDIKCFDSNLRYKIVGAAYQVGIRRIEWGTRTWVHIDAGREEDGYAQDRLFPQG